MVVAAGTRKGTGKTMKAFVNARIVLKNSLVPDGVVLAEDGRIKDFGPGDIVPVPRGADVIDVGGKYLAPGLVDIHTHGGGGHWFYENPTAAAGHFLRHGETTILPALYTNLTLEQYLSAFEKIGAAMKTGDGRAIRGIYMEGPYLNPSYGSDAGNNKWSGEIRREQFEPLTRAAGKLVKVWCIAPERPGIEKFINAVKGEGIILSAAHSEANADELYRFIPDGLRLQTHHANATGIVSKWKGIREFGIDEAVLLSDDIYAELICDSLGIHVKPRMLQLVLKAKGIDKIILVSDCTEFEGHPPDNLKLAPDLRYDNEGLVAGSGLSLDMACRNMMMHTGIGICEVFRLASLNPATLLGMQDEIGSIRKGALADLIVVDDLINVQAVYLRGEKIS
jgi:N-acetylglucosamine-6-phosphate deacetylase